MYNGNRAIFNIINRTIATWMVPNNYDIYFTEWDISLVRFAHS